ncbi:MAG TPA: metallophosphoesterase [Polyangiaceae bacterium]|nr:metallophosphoesterase [Polyangiaceae bacterium]
MRLLKGPYLTGLYDSGADVRFELDGPAAATVEVDRGASDGGARTFEDRAKTTMHVLRATDLASATSYAYVVRVGGRDLARGRFTTAPAQESGAQLKFLVYGDDRTDPAAHAAVVRALVATPSDFLVNTGDMVEDGGRAEDWQAFFDVESPLLRDRALFVAIGNHELYDDRAGANFARYFGFAAPDGRLQPYGTFRLSNVRFFFLNSLHDWSSGEERRWLEAELGRSDGEPGVGWRIAVMHHGPWSAGPHGANAALIAAHVPELLAAHRVDLVFAGHDHIYERGENAGIKFVTSGGGGAPLYRASKTASTRKTESTYHFVEVTTGGEEIRLLARRLDGSVIDQCGFGKGRGWDCDPPDIQASHTLDRGESADATRASQGPAPPPREVTSSPARCGCEVLGGRASSDLGVLLAAASVLSGLCWRRAGGGVDRRGFGPVR